MRKVKGEEESSISAGKVKQQNRQESDADFPRYPPWQIPK